jgi:hypothetical protein
MEELKKDIYEDFTLLVDGKEAFPEILKCIGNAKKSITINMFIWRDDNIGNAIAKAILDARALYPDCSLSDIYDEQNEFRKELVDEVLEEAIQQLLSREEELVTREVTLKLVNRDGHWWVVPHQNLLQILSGLA